MDIRNRLSHMAGQSIKVNGNVYIIDNGGVVRDIPDADGKKLLTMSEWLSHVERKPMLKPAKILEKPQETLEAPEALVEAKEVPEQTEVQEKSEEVPGGLDEWPDPDMNMKKSYLQEMAEAYSIDFENLTKHELVKTIMGKMYPDKY